MLRNLFPLNRSIYSPFPQKMGGFSNRNLLFSSGNPLFSGVYFHSLYDEGQRPSLGVVLLCMAVAHYFFWHFAEMTPCLEGDTSSKPSFLVSMLVFEGLDTPLKINFLHMSSWRFGSDDFPF